MDARVRFASPIGSTAWLATLAAFSALGSLSSSMSVPAQPTLARQFDVPVETAQLQQGLFLLGFALVQAFIGHLSDAWGRRRVMIGALLLYTAAGIACAASPTIESLLACRVLQGAASAAGPVVARAIIRDTHSGARAVRMLSLLLAAFAIAPMIGPILGGLLLAAFGWRAVFVALAAAGVAMTAIAIATLAETLPPASRVRASPAALLRSYRRLLTTPGVRMPMAISCLHWVGQFAYIADSPFVLIDGYGVSSEAFGFYLAATAGALMIGSLFGTRLLRAGRSPGSMLVIGTSLQASGGALIAIAVGVLDLGTVGIVAPMVVFFFGVGVTSPSSTALVMEPVPEIAGTASSAIGVFTSASGAAAGYLTTSLGGSSPVAIAVVVPIVGALALVLASIVAISRRARRTM